MKRLFEPLGFCSWDERELIFCLFVALVLFSKILIRKEPTCTSRVLGLKLGLSHKSQYGYEEKQKVYKTRTSEIFENQTCWNHKSPWWRGRPWIIGSSGWRSCPSPSRWSTICRTWPICLPRGWAWPISTSWRSWIPGAIICPRLVPWAIALPWTTIALPGRVSWSVAFSQWLTRTMTLSWWLPRSVTFPFWRISCWIDIPGNWVTWSVTFSSEWLSRTVALSCRRVSGSVTLSGRWITGPIAFIHWPPGTKRLPRWLSWSIWFPWAGKGRLWSLETIPWSSFSAFSRWGVVGLGRRWGTSVMISPIISEAGSSWRVPFATIGRSVSIWPSSTSSSCPALSSTPEWSSEVSPSPQPTPISPIKASPKSSPASSSPSILTSTSASSPAQNRLNQISSSS